MPDRSSAHKKGEVVGPAGGETGGPHCLAEVYQPLMGYQFCISKNKAKEYYVKKILSNEK
jgi:hypothetical protein